eukprot:SAG31_NODE_31388_length_368_cov_6.282528_1_plen_84_part_01
MPKRVREGQKRKYNECADCWEKATKADQPATKAQPADRAPDERRGARAEGANNSAPALHLRHDLQQAQRVRVTSAIEQNGRGVE